MRTRIIQYLSDFAKSETVGVDEGKLKGNLWRSVYFHHIGKTAGASYTKYFELMFHPDEIFRESGMSRRVIDTDLTKFRFFRGHFPISFAELLPHPCAVTTVIREPKSVILSGYNHLCRLKGEHLGFSHRNGRPLVSFDDFLNDDTFRNRSTNVQTFSLGWRLELSSLVFEATRIPDISWSSTKESTRGSIGSQCFLLYGPNNLDRKSDVLLENARDTLLNKVVGFGLVERELESLMHLKEVLGFSEAPCSLQRLNQAESVDKYEPLRFEDLSKPQADELDSMTRLDVALYVEAEKELLRRTGSMNPPK
jgi:hypothetical protein